MRLVIVDGADGQVVARPTLEEFFRDNEEDEEACAAALAVTEDHRARLVGAGFWIEAPSVPDTCPCVWDGACERHGKAVAK